MKPNAKRPASRGLAALLVTIVAVLVVAYGAANWYLWANQRQLIFLPTANVQRTPADVHLAYEDIRLPIGRNKDAFLHGWWLPTEDATAPALLYLHGNDLNIGGSVEPVARFRRMGFSVLVIDYRGYGKSGGEFPSESQVYEDAEAAWAFLIADRHLDPGSVFIYGHSLGGAVAIELALHHPDAAGLIVESTFTSMSEMATLSYSLFPVDWLLDQRFDSLTKVRTLRVPVLFIHATADREVPYTMSERLYSATQGDKRLMLIPGGGHEDSAAIGATMYTRGIQQFVDDHRRR